MTLIYLVGFMGTGKSAVGKRLAELLEWPFVDLDLEIEKHAAMTIPEIFRLQGEGHFRELETGELRSVSKLGNAVVALGGGAFCSAHNREIVARTGESVWLDAPLDVLFARCSAESAARPLFTTMEEMGALLARRREFYTQATIHIEVGTRTVDDIARQILSSIEGHPSRGTVDGNF